MNGNLFPDMIMVYRLLQKSKSYQKSFLKSSPFFVSEVFLNHHALQIIP